MARENPRKHRNERGDRAGLRGAHNSFAQVPLHDLHHRHGPLRPSTPTWGELAVTAVAVMCVAPALVVGLLLLLEAAQPNANRCASANVAVECAVEAADTTRTP
jgi:hypothetical protein